MFMAPCEMMCCNPNGKLSLVTMGEIILHVRVFFRGLHLVEFFFSSQVLRDDTMFPSSFSFLSLQKFC